MFSGRTVFGFVLVTALVTAMVISGFAAREPDAFKYLFGTVGVLPFAAGIATLCMLFVGARHAEQSLALSRRAELATKYQKGAELLASERISAAISGVAILMDVARENPKAFANSVIETLAACCEEHDRDIFALSADEYKTSRITNDYSSLIVFKCLSACNSIANKIQDHKLELEMMPDGKIGIAGIFLSRYNANKYDLNRFFLQNVILNNFSFVDSNLADTEIEGKVVSDLTFHGCSLSGAKFELTDRFGATITPDMENLVSFINCSHIDDGTINGQAISSFIAKQKRATRKRKAVKPPPTRDHQGP